MCLNIALHLKHIQQLHLVQRVCRSVSVHQVVTNHLHSGQYTAISQIL